jgi:hypothetical protein
MKRRLFNLLTGLSLVAGALLRMQASMGLALRDVARNGFRR